MIFSPCIYAFKAVAYMCALLLFKLLSLKVVRCSYVYLPFLLSKKVLLFTFFPSEGFSVGSQSSVAGYSQLPFPAAFQTHLRSGTEGRLKKHFNM